MSNDSITIEVYWQGGADGYPTANDVTVRKKKNTAVTVTWSKGTGIASIDGFNFTANPKGAITPPAQRNGVWTAVDTVKETAKLKYLVTATSSNGYGQKTSPDPVLENEIEP